MIFSYTCSICYYCTSLNGHTGRIADSVKLAIENRNEEHEEDTFTPLIPGRPGVSLSGKEQTDSAVTEQKSTRLALYEVRTVL